MASRIDALARRLEGDPFFLASALADYARSEGLHDQGLAGVLGCPVEALGALRLCRRPRPQPPLFRQDIATIAARFGVRPEALAAAVRRSDVLARLRKEEAVGEPGTLIAARDRRDEREVGAETEGEDE